ncbi:uncharacterized protein LOC132562682 [Ylistrum balloti]|uniref:uncharacterized protein LOC132562682 n=1 Tax=Ylistrum balloti TaxID=509963 RepID=UPI002905EDA8|nr:uncharacterized protein LOC132562682 [Ylistrum balloti]
MNWVILAYTLFGCLVCADMLLDSCGQECLDFIKSISKEADTIIRTRTAGMWRLNITMKPRTAYTSRWKSLRFPSKGSEYISNLEIRWPINAYPGRIIMFEVSYMKLQDSPGCQADSVQLYNGNSYSDRMDIFCGTSIGLGYYNSTETSTSVRFFSNGDAFVGEGFKIRYRAVALPIPFCFHHYTNQHILTATTEAQVFKSRGYPLSYPSNLREEWLIVKPEANDSLTILVVDADTEYSGNCGYDRVAIYDRSCPNTAAKKVFCGTATPTVTLKGDKFALVRFYADTTNNGRGIMVKYYLEQKTDLTADNSGLDDGSIKSIIVGVIVAVGGFCLSLGIIRWVMRCQERQKRKTENVRRPGREVNENEDSLTSASRRHVHRRSRDDTTITVVAISHSGRTHRNGRSGRNSLTNFTGTVVQPPSYNTLFDSSQSQSEIILKPPAYEAKSYEPPPYPGFPVPPPAIETPRSANRLLPSVHGTRGGNRRNQRRTQHTTRIVVKPQDADREEIRSPPPRYEE